MIPRAILVTLFVSLFLSAPLLASEEEADLTWALEKEKVYKYKISTRSDVKFNIPRFDDATTVVLLENVADLKTASVKTGKKALATMKGKYTQVNFLLELPNQGSTSFDSSSEMDRREAGTDPLKRGLLRLAGKLPFGFKLQAKGGVQRMSGHNRFVPRAFPVRGAKEPINAAANLVLNQLLSDKGVEEAFNDVLIPFPRKEALAGDTWEGESKGVVYPLGGYIFETTFTLKEVKDGKIAVITSTSEVKKDPKVKPGFGINPKDLPGGGWINLDDLIKKFKVVDSNRVGEFEFDLEKKEMIKGKVELTLKLKGSFDNPLSGQAVDIPVTATHKRTLDRIVDEE